MSSNINLNGQKTTHESKSVFNLSTYEDSIPSRAFAETSKQGVRNLNDMTPINEINNS